jgi:hypothetical protein
MFYSTAGVCGKGVADVRAELVAGAAGTAVIRSAACAGRLRENGPSGTARWIAYRGRRRASLFRTSHPGQEMMLGPVLHTPGPAISDHAQSANDRDVTMIATIRLHVTRPEPTVS